MKHGSLFSGIGGFDLAAEWMGWENVFHCEINPFCNKALKHYWPNADSHTDITKSDFTIYRNKVDIITGGDPCQVSSKIGKQEGMAGELYMWPHFFRAIQEAQPVCLVNENVDGTISNGILDRKIADLEGIGYTCWPPIVMPASFVGASHKRDRVILVAYATEGRLQGRVSGPAQRQREIKIRPIEALVENKNGVIVPKPEFLSGNDGIPSWVEQIQGYGNAIVPQVALQIFKAIISFNPLTPPPM